MRQKLEKSSNFKLKKGTDNVTRCRWHRETLDRGSSDKEKKRRGLKYNLGKI
jgi:hypothetical protein